MIEDLDELVSDACVVAFVLPPSQSISVPPEQSRPPTTRGRSAKC